MSIIGKTFKLTGTAIKDYASRQSCFGDAILKLTDNGKIPFVVKSLDKDGCITAIDINGSLHQSGLGSFDTVWCIIMSQEISRYLEEVKPAEPDAKDFWMMTIPTNRSQLPFCAGPYTEEEANEKAQKQIRNAVEGVRVLVVKQVAEAKVKTVLETL
ncbi:hypothetical protein [Enterobacter phage vB-EclM_KMB17]|nr:hypothetical protein [Enterobacter phage vB-EclM_KMB17]